MLISTLAFLLAGTQTAACQAQAPNTPATVVELYTSEGCSSCPPADRWLSDLSINDRTIALGFHVDYWDRLGWPDRLATPAITERQYQWRTAHRGRYVYTPQIIINGNDERAWGRFGTDKSGVTNLPRSTSTVVPGLKLGRQGNLLRAEVAAVAGNPRISGYWAVLSSQLWSEVKRGENAGKTLIHDHAVRLYKPVASWTASEPRQHQLDLGQDPTMSNTRVVFVVTAEDGLRPLQAVSLVCPSDQTTSPPPRR